MSKRDKVICNIKTKSTDGLTLSFYAKCSAYRPDGKQTPKMAVAELSYPSKGVIESLYYCDDNNAASQFNIDKLHKENKIIDLIIFSEEEFIFIVPFWSKLW